MPEQTKDESFSAPENPILVQLNRVGRSEIFSVYQKLASCSDIEGAYAILAQPSSHETSYYDLVFGPYQIIGNAAIVLAAKHRELRRCDALDLGAGTGLTSQAIRPFCKSITAVDSNEALLGIAKKRLDGLGIQHQEIIEDVNRYSPPKLSFDLVAAQGLDPYLTVEQIEKLYRKIYDTLKPGGCHIKYPGHQLDARVYEASPTAVMAGQVVKTIHRLAVAAKDREGKNRTPIRYQDLGFQVKRLSIANSARQVLVFTK